MTLLFILSEVDKISTKWELRQMRARISSRGLVTRIFVRSLAGKKKTFLQIDNERLNSILVQSFKLTSWMLWQTHQLLQKQLCSSIFSLSLFLVPLISELSQLLWYPLCYYKEFQSLLLHYLLILFCVIKFGLLVSIEW